MASHEESDIIKVHVKAFIKDMNALISFHSEKAKATDLPGNLGVIIISGGLAFTAANWYALLKDFGAPVTEEEYTENFMAMVKTALETIDKNRAKPGLDDGDTLQ